MGLCVRASYTGESPARRIFAEVSVKPRDGGVFIVNSEQ